MSHPKGFTLIEIIITILVLAIAAALFVAYMGTSLTGSAVPATQVQKQYELIETMEKITAEYRRRISNEATPFVLTAFETYVRTQNYVDQTKTGIVTLNSPGYTMIRPVLVVVLADGNQSLMSVFTE